MKTIDSVLSNLLAHFRSGRCEPFEAAEHFHSSMVNLPGDWRDVSLSVLGGEPGGEHRDFTEFVDGILKATTHFEFQVWLSADEVWRSVCPTSEPPYRFATSCEAVEAAALCYGKKNGWNDTLWRIVICDSAGSVLKEVA